MAIWVFLSSGCRDYRGSRRRGVRPRFQYVGVSYQRYRVMVSSGRRGRSCSDYRFRFGFIRLASSFLRRNSFVLP